MRQMIVVRDGTALAYAQSYPAHHWPAPHFAGLPADAVALDVFPGPDGVGQGGAWLRALGDLLLLDCSTLAIDPAPENQRAIAAYRKAGFAGNDHRLDAQGGRPRDDPPPMRRTRPSSLPKYPSSPAWRARPLRGRGNPIRP